ncbi:hypothetical protein TNCT_595882 [Trichonephila clavata]|uniref:Uncharacterized protein n=2 Tax=Trichonephila clavata TaxID=2740835 RepID=A0A8X6FDY0_TRICU|nr:hypothetical protein TNCT_595882 [Trichonephila clavata]
MPSGSGIQNSYLSPNNLQVNPMPSGSGIQNSYLSPRLYNPYSSSHESFVLIRRLRRLERLERRRTTRIAHAESQATESRDEEVTTSPPPPESQPLSDSRRNSPPRDSRRNNFQTRWKGEIKPGFQNYGNFNQSEPLNRRLPQDMELFQYNILKKYMDHYVRHGIEYVNYKSSDTGNWISRFRV